MSVTNHLSWTKRSGTPQWSTIWRLALLFHLSMTHVMRLLEIILLELYTYWQANTRAKSHPFQVNSPVLYPKTQNKHLQFTTKFCQVLSRKQCFNVRFWKVMHAVAPRFGGFLPTLITIDPLSLSLKLRFSLKIKGLIACSMQQLSASGYFDPYIFPTCFPHLFDL